MQTPKRMEIPLMFHDIGRIHLEDQVTLGVLSAALQRKAERSVSPSFLCSVVVAQYQLLDAEILLLLPVGKS